MSTDALGDRMKAYESRETGALFIPMIPIYARMDGIGFSNITKGFIYPYDMRFRQAMIATTAWLVEHTQARMGYTQSDEISLCWFADKYDTSTYFSNRKQKMISALAARTSTYFNYILHSSDDAFLHKVAARLPSFDARVYQLPNKVECTNTFLWRELDATKNALQMAARAMYPKKNLERLKGAELHELLYAQGINFNDYPALFKRGTFVQRREYQKTLTDAEWNRIPVDRRPLSRSITRRKTFVLDLPPLARVANRVDVVFDGADALLYNALETA
jgi:tRNA(His) guanylyltransferase